MSQLDYAEGDPLLASLNYSSPVVYFQMLASLNTATCFIHIKMVMVEQRTGSGNLSQRRFGIPVARAAPNDRLSLPTAD
jgi:hypothetical protein